MDFPRFTRSVEEQRRITRQASDRLRRSGHFSLLAQRKVTKRKGLPFAQINPTTGKQKGAFAIRHPWLSAHRRTSCAAPYGASDLSGCSTQQQQQQQQKQKQKQKQKQQMDSSLRWNDGGPTASAL